MTVVSVAQPSTDLAAFGVVKVILTGNQATSNKCQETSNGNNRCNTKQVAQEELANRPTKKYLAHDYF